MYSDLIKKLAPNYDPRHIEAFMRLEYSTLDHLPLSTFKREVSIAMVCVDEGGIEFAESCAKSFCF